MSGWEYHIAWRDVAGPGEDDLDYLNQIGADGWELVERRDTSVDSIGMYLARVTYLFKRERPDEPPADD